MYAEICPIITTNETIARVRNPAFTEQKRTEGETVFPNKGFIHTETFVFEHPSVGPFLHLVGSVFYDPLLAQEGYQTKFFYTISHVDGIRINQENGEVIGITGESVPRGKLKFGKPILVPHIQAE